MRFTVRAVATGLVGVGLGLGGAPLLAQNSVPDAPRPQTLPNLNTITPTARAIPNAPAPQPDAGAAGNSAVPGSSLPSAPAPTTPAEEPQTEAGGAPVQHVAGIRAFTNFVQIPFTVKDSRGNLVPGLTYRDVRVYENGVLQSPRLFTVDPIPLSVAIVIDQSVTFDTMRRINTTLEALQGAFTPYDEVAIYTYNNGVKEQTGFTGAQSMRVTYALQRSKSEGRDPMMYMGGPLSQTTVKNNLPIDPNTNNNTPAGALIQNVPRDFHTLNDAILTAAEQVAKAGRDRRRVIYVISDGKEYGSQAKEKGVIRYLQTNNIAVYATLVGDSAIPGTGWLDRIHLPLQMRDDVLPRYTSATGGECDPEFRPQSIENNFAKLTEQVRIQYTVGYYSHEPFIDGKYRPVDVRVLRPNLTVIAKTGYWPSLNSNPSAPPPPANRTSTAPAAPNSQTGAPTAAPGSSTPPAQ